MYTCTGGAGPRVPGLVPVCCVCYVCGCGWVVGGRVREMDVHSQRAHLLLHLVCLMSCVWR
jgi:hypothetical protein